MLGEAVTLAVRTLIFCTHFTVMSDETQTSAYLRSPSPRRRIRRAHVSEPLLVCPAPQGVLESLGRSLMVSASFDDDIILWDLDLGAAPPPQASTVRAANKTG
jgi:hypothetical protein